MHILTKVLVVFAAVLSIFLAALTIAYSTNTDRITADYNQESARRVAAEALANAQLAQGGEERVRLNAQIEQLNRDLANLRSELAQLQSDNTRLLTDKNKAELDRQSIQAKIAELGETVKTQASLISSYRDEVTTLRRNELAYRKRELELDERVSDLEGQREVLMANVRSLQEQLAEAKQAVDRAASGLASGAGAGGAGEPFVSSGELVTGRVDSVTKDTATGALIAKINLGTNDQIRKNQKLFIVRDGNFLANLIIIETDVRWSAGRIDTLSRPVEVREGDQIFSRLQ